MTDLIWDNLGRAAELYRAAAQDTGPCAEARALLQSLRARSAPARAMLAEMARSAVPDARGMVFACKAQDDDTAILRAREIVYTAGFVRVAPGAAEAPALAFNDSSMTIRIMHHEHMRPAACVEWHRGEMDRDFALRKDNGWYQSGPFIEDDEAAIASFTQALAKLAERGRACGVASASRRAQALTL